MLSSDYCFYRRAISSSILFIGWIITHPMVGLSQTKVETFHPNKRLNESFFVIDKKGTRDGQYVRYHQTGKRIELGSYKNGEKVGIWWNYYSNGIVKSIFDCDKNEKVEFNLDNYPLGRNYGEYPPAAVERRLEGKVEISFQVDSLCRCSGLRIVSSTDPIFESSAIEVGELEMKLLMREQNLKCDNRKMTFPLSFQFH